MTTQPHSNPSEGYAIRVSKKLPKNAANLAYVHVDKPTPSKNVNLKDYTENIQENKANQKTEQILAHLNEEGYLEVDQDVFRSSTPNLLVTNEYAHNLEQTPLFYRYRSQHPVQTDGMEVSVPISGNRLSAPKYIANYRDGQESRFVYTGDKVRIFRSENQPLERGDVFKITLEKEGDKYFIVAYAARDLEQNGYEIHYPAIVEEKTQNQKEILNLSTVFSDETQNKEELSDNNYRVITNDDGSFSVRVEKEAGNFLITEKERAPYTFQYQLVAKVQTRLGDKNPYHVNIGIIYLNQNVFNAVQTTAALKKIVHNNPYMPDYLTFENPHRRSEGVHEKTNSEYWETSLNMPKEHWLDYDILIVSGYGSFDIERMSENIREYLNYGGILLVESAGTGDDSLDLLNNRITDVTFSKTQEEEGIRQMASDLVKERYYDIEDVERIGTQAPVLRFLGQENEADWEPFVQHTAGGYSLMRKKTEPVGQLLYSNMGLLKDILYNNTSALKLFVNLMLVLLEERSFITPVYNEFVYHKDDLYAEEYTDESGRSIYINDKADEDQTQVVAKKVLNPRIEDRVVPYLPSAYRNWNSIHIESKLFDKEQITLQNPHFNMSGENSVFEETTIHALPGFRYVSYAGNQGKGEHVVSENAGTPTHIRVDTEATQAFFEQEVGQLSPGHYELSVHAASEGTVQGGFAVYDVRGEPIASQSIIGERGWRSYRLSFEIEEPQTVYLRLGAFGEPSIAKLLFSEVSLMSQGLVRMTEESAGGEPLYAYAISPKGKNNQLVAYEQTYSNPTILKENYEIQTTLRVRSFVYRWFSEEGRYHKEYGNEKETLVSIHTKDREKILGNILEFIPPLYSGVEWSRKQNVFYELELEDDTFLNISLYDPSIDRFFFAADGRWVISHEDIWWNGYESTIQLKLHTRFYHLLATDNQFTIGYALNKALRVMLPETEDERDRWHLSIQNGGFNKTSINASELEELKALDKEDHYDEYLVGEHSYMLPEYYRQTFYPHFGEKLVSEERAVYVNPHKIEVQQTPMIIKELDVEKERMTPSRDRKVWHSQNIFWDASRLPQVYLDQNNTGQLVLLNRGYRINYQEGKVVLDEPTDGTIYASYLHDNFKVYKRNFENKHVKDELMRTRDGHTFQVSKENITVMPAPKFYLGRPSKETLVHPSRYWIDYEAGSVHFFEHIAGRVYATYSYFTEEELTYRDLNKNTGEIYLDERISFKDEIYVTYLAEENNLEYKGYYDESLQQFIRLDLNPTSGHSFDYIQSELHNPIQQRSTDNEKTFRLLTDKRYLERNSKGDLVEGNIQIKGVNQVGGGEDDSPLYGYFAVYEQQKTPLTVEDYTRMSLEDKLEDTHYIISQGENPFVRTYLSEQPETGIEYAAKTKAGNLKIEWYQDTELTVLLDTTIIPVVNEGMAPTEAQTNRYGRSISVSVEKREGNELLDKEIFVYLLPYRSMYYKKEVLNEHTVRHVFNRENWERVKEVYPEALLLAQVQVRENTNKENIVLMDARRPGGGLKENIKEADIEKRVGNTSAFWDIGSFDGLAYYRNGVLVLRIPDKVLAVNGGPFTEDGVREITDKYMAYGTYPIIEFTKED